MLLLACTTAVKKPKGDLPVDAPLRVGIKFRPRECSRKSGKGDLLSMHYTGSLRKSGTKFDSSLDRDSPFQFTLGGGQVIKGWDQGLLAMCVGERRRLTIPSGLVCRLRLRCARALEAACPRFPLTPHPEPVCAHTYSMHTFARAIGQGYGDAGSPPRIPSRATLVFDVELLAIASQ